MSDVLPSAGSEFGQRVRRRLHGEKVGWLTTIGRDGTPQPNPVWFVWDESAGTVLTYNRADAHRLVHVEHRPRACLHLNATADGDDVVVVTGHAELAEGARAPHQHPAYSAKYGTSMRRVSGSAERFSEEYPVPLVLHVDRVRGF